MASIQTSTARPDAAVPPDALPMLDLEPLDPSWLSRSFSNTMGAILDAVAESDQVIAAEMATRARLIDQAREWSEATASTYQDPSTVRRWTNNAVARRSLVTELACILRLPERTAENLIEQSRSLLHELPATLDALTHGDISYRHAQVIIDQAMSLPEEARRSFEAAAVPFAVVLTPSKLDRKARILRERAHPDTIETRNAACVGDRDVTLEPARDGMAWLSAYLPAVQAYAIYNRVTDIAVGLQAPDEPRTLTQIRADVLADLLIDGVTTPPELPSTDGRTIDSRSVHGRSADGRSVDGRSGRRLGHGIHATVFITVPVLTLLGTSDEPATLEGYGPIAIETARELTAEAPSLIRILTHPETGAILSVGRTRYSIPNDLRIWLRIRDETCRYVGCARAAVRCDIDHTLDWHYLGETEHDNLSHLCPAHHDLKHHSGWTVEQVGSGALEWTSPTGRSYRTEPAAQLNP